MADQAKVTRIRRTAELPLFARNEKDRRLKYPHRAAARDGFDVRTRGLRVSLNNRGGSAPGWRAAAMFRLSTHKPFYDSYQPRIQHCIVMIVAIAEAMERPPEHALRLIEAAPARNQALLDFGNRQVRAVDFRAGPRMSCCDTSAQASRGVVDCKGVPWRETRCATRIPTSLRDTCLRHCASRAGLSFTISK